MIKNKCVLITGASSGIGKALAEKFAAEANSLVLVARRTDRLEDLAAYLESKFKIKAHVVACDLSKLANVKQLVQELQAKNLTIDVLVNNAGARTGRRFCG